MTCVHGFGGHARPDGVGELEQGVHAADDFAMHGDAGQQAIAAERRVSVHKR